MSDADRAEFGRWAEKIDKSVKAKAAERKARTEQSELNAKKLRKLMKRIERLEARMPAAPPVVTSETSDGYHTFAELYEYRMLYHAHAAMGWIAAGVPVVKSWKHSDGEPCFGGGWFIVVAELESGQVSNHYKARYWDLFRVPEVALPPEYDEHTPAEAARRLAEVLRAPHGFKSESELGSNFHGEHSRVLDWTRDLALCMNGDPHDSHVWFYTSEGGGHMIEARYAGEEDRRWNCPGRTTREVID